MEFAMLLEELVTLKALERKRLNHGGGDIQDQIIDTVLMKSDGAEYRNLCAHISIPLADEVDSICTSLDISKRRFIEGALIDAVKRANAIVSQVQPFDLEA
jgi:hypothetical protein